MDVNAVIWDLDGVILDNELLHIDAEIDTLSSLGIPLTREIALEYLGVRLTDYFRDIRTRFQVQVPLPQMLERHHATLTHYYGEVFPLTAHLLEVLERLSGKYLLGLATNRERDLAERALTRFSLKIYFHTMLFGEDVKKGKPDPELYLKAAKNLGVVPAVCTAVEDTGPGFTAAKNAGMTVIARRAEHNRHIDFSIADHIVEDLREIPGAVKQLRRR